MDVNVPKGKVFIINKDGDITCVDFPSYSKTYSDMAEMAEEMFPTIVDRNSGYYRSASCPPITLTPSSP